MRKTTKKYGGLDSDDVKSVGNAAKRILVNTGRMTAHVIENDGKGTRIRK